MRRHLNIGALLCALAIWVQFLAPVAAMSMEGGPDPFSIICSSSATQDGGSKHAPTQHHDHQHCLLCHSYLGAAPVVDRPAFTTLDLPVASTRRWRRIDLDIQRSTRPQVFQPRGPPV